MEEIEIRLGLTLMLAVFVFALLVFIKVCKIKRKLYQMANAVEQYMDTVLADEGEKKEESLTQNWEKKEGAKKCSKTEPKWSKETQNRLISEVIGEYFS